jgi:N-acetylmuramoyl-L-alanine amidase
MIFERFNTAGVCCATIGAMSFIHSVEPGECLASLAYRFGFLSYRTIYDHPQNAKLKQLRTDPNILFPGDNVFIPDHPEPRSEFRPTGNVHRFQIKREKTKLRIVLKKGNNQPFSNLRYLLRIDGGEFSGRTDASGLLEQAIPPDVTTGELTLFLNDTNDDGFLRWSLRVGNLDPVDTITGVQARLNNLGFFCGAEDGILGRRTLRAVENFQAQQNLTQTGQLDQATRAALQQGHDRD